MKESNFYRCYSRKLNDFLKVTGIKSKSQGAHTTGLQISKNGFEWDDFTNIHKAHEAYPELSLDYLAAMRDQSLNKRVTIVDEDTGLEIRRRVRIFHVYEKNDSLSYALKRWNETKPRN